MQEPIDAILTERLQEPGGFASMASVSAVAHAALFAAALLMPGLWPSSTSRENREVMTISLGGSAGPRTGGLQALSSRAIQEVVPPAPAARPEPIRPPAAQTPEMTMPDPAAKTKAAPKNAPEVKAAPTEAKGRTPSKGAEANPGKALVETGASGAGEGLTTFGGGGGTGGYLDTKDFCCPEYLITMKNLIERNWNGRQGVSGTVLMKFTIQRDGLLTGIEVEKPSGFIPLDLAAQRAVILTRQLPALPSAYTGSDLTVHINFVYQR
jgi:TonB family protein